MEILTEIFPTEKYILKSAAVEFQITNAYQVHDRFKSSKLRQCSINHDGGENRDVHTLCIVY